MLLLRVGPSTRLSVGPPNVCLGARELLLRRCCELLLGDPAQTLVNKHASHVWSKV
ncbi:hypothetical protein C8Q74DRAFT_1230486, partial [Fomes fomentarius]